MSKIVVPSKKKIEIEIEGKVYEMRRPTLSEQDAYTEKWAAATNAKDQTEVILTHLENLGMPKEVSSQLDLDQFQFVLETIANAKKN